jgi:hypothetical protein
MSFLLDHDTCAGFFRGRQTVTSRFMVHRGNLHVCALPMRPPGWAFTFAPPARVSPPVPLVVAATAQLRNWTLVTHSPQTYAGIPNLTLADWFVP